MTPICRGCVPAFAGVSHIEARTAARDSTGACEDVATRLPALGPGRGPATIRHCGHSGQVEIVAPLDR